LGDNHAKIALTASVAAYFVGEGLVFGFMFQLYPAIGLILSGVLVYLALSHYHLRKINYFPSYIQQKLQWLSRHSLDIYFYHLILLQIIFLIIHSG